MLSDMLNEASATHEGIDNRINENLRVIVTEAEQIVKSGIPQTIWHLVGGVALGTLLVVILSCAGAKAIGPAVVGFGGAGVCLLAMLGIWGFMRLAGHLKRRRFCQDVLRIFGPEAPRTDKFH
jgi:hypothetical protein